jgi:4a-hydroxytetrahydrobiopterin dehydratase
MVNERRRAMVVERRALTEAEIRVALKPLDGWQVVDGKLHRVYRFKDFVEAMGYMVSAAMVVQQLDHHPEWSNVYNTVTIDLVTHDLGGISPADVDLACRLHELAARRMTSAV